MRPWLLTCYAGIALAMFGAGVSAATSHYLGWTPVSTALTLAAGGSGLYLLGVLAGVR